MAWPRDGGSDVLPEGNTFLGSVSSEAPAGLTELAFAGAEGGSRSYLEEQRLAAVDDERAVAEREVPGLAPSRGTDFAANQSATWWSRAGSLTNVASPSTTTSSPSSSDCTRL